jgi:hypothetical protein
MKWILYTIFYSLVSWAQARPCEVYGISDGPQKLDCSFKKFSLFLRCQNGTYFINRSRVSHAFHFEVEDGPTPLVFKTNDSELVVTMGNRIEAEFTIDEKKFSGTCLSP